MDMSTKHIEQLAGEQLRKLPLEESYEDGIYGAACILELEDNDEISAAEGGFMLGYLGAL